MKTLAQLREFFSRDRYATETTGIEILEAGDGYAKVGLKVRDGHMNAGDRVMGAVYYTMADFAFAVASNPDAGDAPITFTLSSQINFLTAAKGRYLTAEAKAVRKGRKTSFYAAEIRDELGTLVATVSSNGYRMDK
ncbi:MAG: PaaI family thioesterase [Lachnospiraceae bacterium]|nr:PaaI family thioesterase [Lachnospiraceae bacterium]